MAQYEGVITLQNVNDGAAGRGVSSIETKYYLGDSSTQHPSDTSSDWQDSLPALEQGKYLWTQTKVSYTSGDPVYNYSISYVATDGTITTQYYTRIKYAEDNQGTNWSDTPTSTTTYVGFYSGIEQSPAASQYTWSRYVGENGENGRGISNTVVEYNSSSNNTSAPTGGWQSTIPSVDENSYLWTRTTITYTDNTTSISYTVAKQGAKGETGNAGKGISSTVIRYAVSDSGTVAPTGASNWKANLSDVTVNPGQFLWTRTVITYTDTTTSTSYSVAQYGETGAAGTSITITNREITYAGSTSGTETPSDGWSLAIPSIANGHYLWTRTVVTYSDGSNTTAYSVAYKGTNGTNGTNGDDGRDVVVDTNNSFVKYIVSTNGTQHPSSTANWDTSFPASIPAGRFLWTWVHTAYKYSDGTSTNTSTDSYSVARQGEDGEDGNKYYVKSNIDTIKRLFDVDGNDIVYMPVQFEFQVFDNDNSTTPLQTNQYDYIATLISSDLSVIENVTSKCTTAPQTNPDTVVLSIEKLQELGETVSLAIEDYQIRFEVLYPAENGKVVAQYTVSIENGLETDFARFKVNAANISANIATAGLVFSSEGLTINNGNFTIKNASNEELFKYDKTLQSLSVIGNGTFTGNIYANDGEFTGIIHAESGEFRGQIEALSGNIGGFTISDGILISTDTQQSILLNGKDGLIIANNIELGVGAKINNYLKLGSAYIYNPDIAGRNNLLISAGSDTIEDGYLKIYDTGYIDLGNIRLDGQNSIINLNSNDAKITAGNNVIITPDRSVFNNVDVTGTIHTSVFEVGKVQTAGGAMIFKEGAEIDTITQNGNNYSFTTKTPINLVINSIVLFTNKEESQSSVYGQIIEVNDNVYTTSANIMGYTNVIQLADTEEKSYAFDDTTESFDNTPYNFRKSGGDISIGDREFDEIVGGTVAWNQKLQNSNAVETYTRHNLTFTRISDVFGFSVSGTFAPAQDRNAYIYKGNPSFIAIVSGHKYLVTNTSKYANTYLYGVSFTGNRLNQNPVGGNVYLANETGNLNFSLHWGNNIQDGTEINETVLINIFDLTQMYGSTIADYIYTLERGRAGDGVAWFRKLFPKAYYDYNAGELMSVKTSAHKMVGFNALNINRTAGTLSGGYSNTAKRSFEFDKYYVGLSYNNYYNPSIITESHVNNPAGEVGQTTTYNAYGVAFPIKVVPNTTYYCAVTTVKGLPTVGVGFYDADGNPLNFMAGAMNRTFTTPANCHIATIVVYGNTSGGIAVKDININLSSTRNGEYEPYEEHTYPLDGNLTLRGIPKLDGNNELYYDGDIYSSDGTVTRLYEQRAYQSGDESLVDAITDGTNTVVKLAETTTETATPYTNPQIVAKGGTEEYIDARNVAIPVGHNTNYFYNMENNLVIGINSGSHSEKMLYPQALTMREIIGFENNEPIYQDNPSLVLGNLDNIIPSNSNIKGFGLYGQNVYLTGSLVTEFTSGQNVSYAGVNTFNGVTAIVFDNVEGVTQDNSKIVFWGGALPANHNNDLDKAIQNAPFQVTENGSFYAGQGYFKGAIITDAEIRAASIYTADIYGNNDSGDVLKIHDTNGGIGFYSGDTRLLNITNNGFTLRENSTSFISINNNEINFTGDTFIGTTFRGNFEGDLTTQKNEVGKYIGFDGPTVQGRQATNDTYTVLSYLTLDTEIKLTNNTESITLESGKVDIAADITSMSKDVYFGEKMKYQQIIENNQILGYDLYIS